MKFKTFTKRAFLAALMCSSVGLMQAKDVYLSNPSLGGDDANDGSTPELAVATLSRAYAVIGAAAGPHAIYVSGEVDGYSNPADVSAPAQPNVYPFLGAAYTLVVQGVEGSNAKLVGNGAARMFRLRSDMVLQLRNLTLSGTPESIATFDGGCIQLNGGSLEADNCIFENFSASNYGAVVHVLNVSKAYPLIAFRNCVFNNNIATGSMGYGSVMRIADYGTGPDANVRANAKVYVENCAFTNNTALYGTFFFRTNFVDLNALPEITFVNSTFTGNTNENGNSGCLAIYSGNETVNIINCTFKGNNGNGIRATAAATVNVYNTISESNTVFDLNADNAPILNISNSLLFNVRNAPDYAKPAEYNSTDMLLDAFDAETNSFTPIEESLAIGYGDATYLQALNIDYDQLNQPRLFTDNLCDIGAVEVQVPTGIQAAEVQNVAAYAGAAGQIIVQSDAPTASVYNIAGQQLTEQTLNDGINTINRQFDAGIYLVKTGSVTTKVVVK
jgi:hypothetical protein